MTEFEIATLASRSLGHWLSAGQLAIGLGQIAVVWYGIRAMTRAGDRREREHERRHTEAMQRLATEHTATMTALRELITRTARAAD